MSRTDRWIAVGLALAASAMAIAGLDSGPASAAPSPTKGFEAAKFKVEVKGWQRTLLKHTHEAVDGCDVSDFSTGSERISFRSKPIVITAIHAPGTFNPEFFAGRRLGIPTVATVERSFSPVFGVPSHCEEANGGADDLVVPIPDCGKKTKSPFLVKLEYPETEHDRLMLTVAESYEDLYSDCPAAGPLGYPFLIDFDSKGRAIAAKLTQDELFDPGFRKWISIARGTDKEVADDYGAQAQIHWAVSFTRLKGE